jgi:hypothetical protein
MATPVSGNDNYTHVNNELVSATSVNEALIQAGLPANGQLRVRVCQLRGTLPLAFGNQFSVVDKITGNQVRLDTNERVLMVCNTQADGAAALAMGVATIQLGVALAAGNGQALVNNLTPANLVAVYNGTGAAQLSLTSIPTVQATASYLSADLLVANITAGVPEWILITMSEGSPPRFA